MLKIEICEHDLIEALLSAGRITEPAALERTAVETAAAGILREWARAWTR